MRLGVQLARHAVQLAYAQVDSEDVNSANTDKLGTAHAYLQPPFSAKSFAKAYNLVMDVRNFSKNCSEQCEVLSKNAAMAIRDALVLQICCGVDSMSYVRFEFAVESAFNIQKHKSFQIHMWGTGRLRFSNAFVLQKHSDLGSGSELI